MRKPERVTSPTLPALSPCVLPANSEQPQIMEYIKLKAQVAGLQKEAADWQRKLEVACAAAARSGGRSPSSAAGGIRSRSGGIRQ